MLDRLNSLWVGKELSCIEKLCMVSAISVGHPFTLYSYDPDLLSSVPEGVEIRDAREVLSRPELMRFFKDGHSALGSDFFRYALMGKGLGFWVDLDCFFLKPLDFDDDLVFGWESSHSINGAVLRIPKDSQMLRVLLELPKLNWRPPFFGPKRTLQFYWKRITRGNIGPDELPWGSYGPALLTYLAGKYQLAHRAKDRKAFYPVPYEEAAALFEPGQRVEAMITRETYVVHMWHSTLKGRLLNVPADSYLARACERHGLVTPRNSQ